MIFVERYLERIGITQKEEPVYDYLAKLQRAHLLSIPFETHDIHNGIPIICEEGKFLDKILTRERGGFCYELNSSFAWLLRNLGFNVTLLSGRVNRTEGGFGPEFDHMTLLVHLNRDYVVDVGYTNFSAIPMTLNGEEKNDMLGLSKIERVENGDYAFYRFEENNWKTEYLFTLQPYQLQDFFQMCKFHESSPESPFVKKPLAVIYSPNGRITLSGNTLTILENGNKVSKEVSDDEKKDLLNKQFGILCP